MIFKNKRETLFISVLLLMAALSTGCAAGWQTGSQDGLSEDPAAAGRTDVSDEETEPVLPVYRLSREDEYYSNGVSLEMRAAGLETVVFQYPAISGLRNETAMSRVNVSLFEHVRAEVEALLDAFPEGVRKFSSGSTLFSSFANTLSVRTTLLIDELPEGADPAGRSLSVEFYDNFELVTGRRIEFRDLFREETDLEALFGKVEAEDRRFLSALRRGESVPFRFDEKEAAIVDENGAPVKAFEVRYMDHMDDVMIYERYRTEENLYIHPKETPFPVFIKRFPCYSEIYRSLDRAYVDAVLYANLYEFKQYVAEDAAERLLSRILTVEEESAALIYNAELSLYEMKNGSYDGIPAPYYVTVREYVWTPKASLFDARVRAIVDFLQEETDTEALLSKNIFAEAFKEDYPEEIEERHVTWYYDADGFFLGERIRNPIQ